MEKGLMLELYVEVVLVVGTAVNLTVTPDTESSLHRLSGFPPTRTPLPVQRKTFCTVCMLYVLYLYVLYFVKTLGID